MTKRGLPVDSWNDRLRTEEQMTQIHGHSFVPILWRDVGERMSIVVRSIVHEHIETAEGGNRSIDDLLNAVRRADVGSDRQHPLRSTGQCSDLRRGGLEAGCRPRAQTHAAPFGRKRPRTGQTKATAGPSYHGHFVSKPEIHVSSMAPGCGPWFVVRNSS